MEGRKHETHRGMKNALIAYAVIVVLAILIELQITWMLSRSSAGRSTTLLLNQVEQILDDNEENEKTHTEELKETYISYAETVGYILSAKPELIYDIDELKRIAEFEHIDEIHIFDSTGTIISGTVPEYYGYSFDSGEQMGYFKPMLDDKTLTMCQDVTPNTAEGKSMMYALTWNQDGTFMVQVGIEPTRLLAELEENNISNVIENIPIMNGFEIYVVDPETKEIIAGTDSENVGSGLAAAYAGVIGSAAAQSGKGIIRHKGTPYFCNYRWIDGYIVAVAYAMRSSAASIYVPMAIISVYLILAGLLILYLFLRLSKTEKKEQEQVRLLEEDEDIIRAAGHGIWRCPISADGHVTGMIGNGEWEHIFGCENTDMTPEERLRFFVDGLVNKSDDPSQLDYSDLKSDAIVHMTFPWNHPSKGLIYVEISGSRHIASDGEVQVSGYAADVTEQTAAKQKWEKDILEAREKAEAASKAKTTFLFNMSHDIRTPMNAIIGFTDLIEKHYDEKEKCMDYLHKTQEANRFLLSLINNVLEMARIESGKEELQETITRCGSIAHEIASIFEEQMQKKNITFTETIDVQTGYMLCDQPKLREICLNILSNALKYTPDGGTISMTIRELPSEREGYALMQGIFSDTGIGMSEEFLPHIFEEFTRAQSSTESRQQGTGLGMPIVKKLIDLMGGTIDVQSELGKGSTFTVSLYFRIVSHETAEQADTEETVDTSDFNGRKILLAEDNDLNAEIAMEILSDAGFSVERAENGAVCIDWLLEKEAGYYDLILMDIQMPVMDGYTAAKRIRAMNDPSRSQIPIIAMTANAFDSDRQNALNAGMNEHVAKPINLADLMRTISSVIRR